MTYMSNPPLYRRWLAGILSVLIGLGPLATPVYAWNDPLPTLLGDGPLNVTNSAPPNVVLTVDDSTSMLFDFLPDYVINAFCRDATGKMASQCGSFDSNFDLSSINHGQYKTPGYIFQQYGIPYPAYDASFDTSGPGAGCNTAGTIATSTCSGGISPGALPGLATYPNPAGPPPGKSPKAGSAYEYWTLWPAPVHNSALNHLYYNPVLTYDPAVYADATSYPQMSAANTTTWTRVPADPWAPAVVYVDLTTAITVGQWCNSDWTQGTNAATGTLFATDPAFCRSNGLVAAASSGAPAADGDYTYPWAWPGGTALKDPKYFYQNDNILWCNTVSTPQTCNGGNQTCNNSAQTCGGGTPQTCTGTPQTCNGLAAQACNGAGSQVCNVNPQVCTLTPQACNITTQVCNVVNQTCQGGGTQTCNNIQTQTCQGGTQTCQGGGTQTCNGGGAQTCNGGGAQTCNGGGAQTCVGGGAQTCASITTQVCSGYVASQTCSNITSVCTPAPASSCTTDWSPPGCNITCGPGSSAPECVTCGLATTCPPPTCVTQGACSSTGVTCTAANAATACPAIMGACSKDGSACTSSATCLATGRCSSTGATCTAANAATVCTVQSGKCSGTNAACTAATAAADCPVQNGKCSSSNVSCNATTPCAVANGACSITNAACTAATAATACPAQNGSCSRTGASCTAATAATACPVQNGACSITAVACTAATAATVCTPQAGTCSRTGVSCTAATAATACPATGQCSRTSAACTAANVATACPVQPGTCSRTNATCTVATAATDCPPQGTCSATSAACTVATQATACPDQGRCSATNATCTTANQATTCPDQGRCSITNATCTAANQATACPVQGFCSIQTTRTCTASNAATRCLPQTGTCSATGGNCTLATDCPQSGRCSSTNAVCTAANAATACPDQNLKCSLTGVSCTAANAASKCLPQGTVCSIDKSACVANSDCTGFCSVNTTQVCTSNSACKGTCSGTGASCTGSGAGTCPIVAGLPGSSVCSDTLPSSATTLFQDANGAGTTCRRNNQAYADGTVASRFNYPSGIYTTPVTGGTGASACTATARYASIPRHYWKTEVEWCDNAVGLVGDKWAGYGTRTVGSCQPSRDATHIKPRFYQFGAAPGTDNYATPAFQRVDLDIAKRATATYTHTWTDDTGTLQTITRSFDEEMTNYANWFAYYRTRIQAVKTVTSLSFLAKLGNTYNVDNKFRVGFHTFYNNVHPTSFVNVAAFDLAQKAAWATQLFGIDIPLGQETPTLDAVTRVGEYYKNGASAQLSGATDPIILSCQKNWHMLFTDGFTHQGVLPTVTYGNVDKTVTLPAGMTVAGLTVGAAWPPLFIENASTATSNSVSDYATYYWATDFRTAGPMATDNVPAAPDIYSGDPAYWQHQNFAALSLGTEGKLPIDNQSLTEQALRAGTVSWPVPVTNLGVPSVNMPDQSGVDDLWHAAINGHGRFVNAQSADELKIGIGQILGDIMSASGVRAGVGFRSVNLGTGANYGYKVGFSAGWSGSVIKLLIDPLTGAEIANSAIWNGATQLVSQLTIVPGVKDTPWFTERKIVTMNATGTPVPFLWASLSATQQDSLAPGKPIRGQAVLEFLRGNQTLEGNKTGQLRIRKNPLGDIVNAQPVYVGAPGAPYLDGNDPGYSTFVSSNAGRVGRVYVGANDGMMHAFDDATGNESWAYVPQALYRGDNTGIGALAYQDAALPPFRHHPYVDSTPRIVDVDFGGQDWHTLLVGGLGKGGKSYYAIDVTKPADVISEATAAGKVLWEFTHADMGFSYGKPLIAKTRAFGWVVIVAAGYDNATGDGKLFVLNPQTGALLKTMSTGAGTATNPSGLAHIAGYTQDYRNQLVEQIYAGDLLGNFWRFDVSDPTSGNWVVEKLGTLTDASGTRQPVTTPPQMEIDIGNGVDRWVFIGTGRLLDETDLASTQIQTMYAFRDGTATTPGPINASTPVARTTTGMEQVLDNVNGLTLTRPDKGWYFDLPAGQRVIVPVQAALSVVAFIGTSPQTDPCTTGQPATVYAKGFTQANTVLVDPITGNLTGGIYSPEGAVGLEMIIVQPGPLDPPGSVHLHLAVTLGTTGNILSPDVRLPDFVMQHRMSWRLLAE